ncbi:DUF2332 family protein [Microbacterium sp. P03]|uniref:DUF2332 family protein n=1 Tax=Microbacterium sp. P03 TaxID=3366946 RepID=UPI0037473468
MKTDAAADVAARYERFAQAEAPGRSELYAQWADGVARDVDVQRIIARIAPTHRQPPLVFAVSRLLGAPEQEYAAWAEWLRRHADALIAECGRRSLQTNEPLRCAALLPALAAIDGPLALLEIGASAGLCLYPDRYSYRYTASERGSAVTCLDPPDGASSVTLECDLRGDRLPTLRMPEVVWRAGIDLHPLDAADAADRRFLTTLAWPGEQGRAARIDAALEVAASDPPLLVRGDATDRAVLEAVAEQAPRQATLVITTPGVLPHIPREGRGRLIDAVRSLPARWVTIDPPTLHSEWHPAIDASRCHGFVLGLDGVPLAAVDPLGGFVEWRA